MRVARVARRRERLEELATKIGDAASVHVCDVGERAQVEQTATAVLNQLGDVDLLANSAGFLQHVLFQDQALDEEHWTFGTPPCCNRRVNDRTPWAARIMIAAVGGRLLGLSIEPLTLSGGWRT